MQPALSVIASPNDQGWTCSVRVEEAGRAFEYEVHVSDEDLRRLAPGKSVEDLVERSFRFLLEREPPQSILREFRLTEIARYFPDYPRIITG